jgi:hypothetical protein
MLNVDTAATEHCARFAFFQGYAPKLITTKCILRFDFETLLKRMYNVNYNRPSAVTKGGTKYPPDVPDTNTQIRKQAFSAWTGGLCTEIHPKFVLLILG